MPEVTVISLGVRGSYREERFAEFTAKLEAWLDANPEWESDEVRISFQSLTVPATVASVARGTGDMSVLKRTETPNVDLASYVAMREWAVAPDGTRVPVDIVRHRDTPLDGSAPCLLYAYGSYEASMAPWLPARCWAGSCRKRATGISTGGSGDGL